MPLVFSTTTAKASSPEAAADLGAEIAANAGQDRSITADGVTTTAHSLPEQIAADRYLSGKKARRNRGLLIRVHRIKPGGTV